MGRPRTLYVYKHHFIDQMMPISYALLYINIIFLFANIAFNHLIRSIIHYHFTIRYTFFCPHSLECKSTSFFSCMQVLCQKNVILFSVFFIRTIHTWYTNFPTCPTILPAVFFLIVYR